MEFSFSLEKVCELFDNSYFREFLSNYVDDIALYSVQKKPHP